MDRFSGLPDDVMGHIFSFLPTINSLVQTSTLAKAWRFRWAHVTSTAYYRSETPSQPDSNYPRKPDIITSTNFHIGTTTDSEFELWISALCNVRKLVIHLDHHHLKFPPCLFASQTLVHLCLVDCCCISKRFTIDFPALKKLQLNNVVFECEESLPHMLSRCPVLDELIIERVIFSEKVERRLITVCFYVHSPTLTRLVLVLDKVCLDLRTPALRYLHLRVRRSMGGVGWAPLDSLIEANIDLSEDKFERMFSDQGFYAFTVKQFVSKCCNVKCLTLSTRRVPWRWPRPFTLDVGFHNLTELKLSADWQFVTSFLVKADNLRVLTICRMVDHKAQHWIEPKPLPNCWRSHIDKTTCLKSHLERVSVVDFGWARKQEFDMVSYILKYAKVLKTMEIVYTPQYELDSNQKLEAHNKLASFERGSKKCQLLFV